MLGRRGVIADYIAAVRGTLAMRRERGQVRIELAFLGAAAVVALVGVYSVFVQGDGGGAGAAERAALGLPVDDRFTDTGGLTVVDGDGFVVSDEAGIAGDGDGDEPGAGAVGTDGAGAAAGPGSTEPGSVPEGAPATGVLPSEGSSGGGTPGEVLPGDHGDGDTGTNLPPGSGTDPGTSTSSSTLPSSQPEQPDTTPSTGTPGDGGLLGALVDLLGL